MARRQSVICCQGLTVFEVMREPALDPQVLLVAIGTQALRALFDVLATQRGLVDRAAERGS
jgi:hypothetical protein